MSKNLSGKQLKVEKNSVYINTPEFQNNNGKVSILLIHAEWCGWCKKFLPDYEKLNSILGDSVNCYKIEEQQLKSNTEAAQGLKFKSYPTIKFVDQNGKVIRDFNGERTIENLLQETCEVFHHCVEYH